jgi:putative PIN family toxin of toxin-antitoxin system
LRIFLDTHVLASALGTRGLCSEVLESVIHDHELLTCQEVLRALERVLAGKFGLPEALVDGFLALLQREGEVLEPRTNPSIAIKDANDIPILACAIGGKSDMFVTADKELLELQQVSGVAIVSPRGLWLRLAGLEEPAKRK